MSDEKKIEFNQSDVINALLHAKQSEHHYATQESVDNLKERMNEKFAAQNERSMLTQGKLTSDSSKLTSDSNRLTNGSSRLINDSTS